MAARHALLGPSYFPRGSYARDSLAFGLGFKIAGLSIAGYLLGTTIALSLISLVAVWFGYAWAKRASGTPAAIIAAIACSFFFGFIYFAPKALYEVVAAHILLPGLYLGVYSERLGERKRLFFAGFFCALAACLRMQLLPAIVFAMIYFCYPRWRREFQSLRPEHRSLCFSLALQTGSLGPIRGSRSSSTTKRTWSAGRAKN